MLREQHMTLTIKAHFDGKVIVPDEPVDLPVGKSLEVEVNLSEDMNNQSPSIQELFSDKQRRRRVAFEYFRDRTLAGTSIPDESLRREHLYDDRQ
jgi:hypothetical protein